MNIRDLIQKHPLVYVGGVWVAGLTMGITGFLWLISYSNQEIISKDKFKTIEQIDKEYTPNKEYQIQKTLAETYQTKYQEVLSKYFKITSSQPHSRAFATRVKSFWYESTKKP